MTCHTPSAEWLCRVAANHDRHDERFALERGMELAEYRDAALLALVRLVEACRLQIHLSSEAAIGFLREGRWRTVFHGVPSSGINDLDARRATEAAVLGIAQDTGPDGRPAYGSLRGSDEDYVSGFGLIVLYLDDRVRERVTFCMADSLDWSDCGTSASVAATAVDDPQLASRYAETDLLSANELTDACRPADRYAEIQIFDRISVMDVESVGHHGPLPVELRLLLDDNNLVPQPLS